MKKIFVLIIFFCPLILIAQNSSKNKSATKHVTSKKTSIKKETYSDDEIRLNNLLSSFYEKRNLTESLITEKNDSSKKVTFLSDKIRLKQEIDSLNKIYEQIESKIKTVCFNFIKENPSSFLSLHRLSMMLSQSAELPFYVDTITTLYNNLNKNIQNSTSGKHFKLMLINLNNSKVGSLAPAFTVNDIYSQPISLSSFRNNKYVLLDFWASWCVPCREDIPYLKEIYKKYNPKGLEIIGISKDDDVSAWKKAIAEDKTQNWRHILAPLHNQKNDSLVTNKYFVNSIPVKILINKEGIIIGRWSGSGDENMDALKKLLNKAFSEK